MYGNKSHSKHYRVGGTRGGQDHFKWDEVKNDKYRENYLGNSLHAPVGRWQKGKDLTWYAKSKTEQDASLEEERRRLRALDEDLMNEALGIRAQKKWNERETLDNDEIRRLLAKGETVSAGEGETDLVDRSKGLGAAPAKFHEHIDRKSRLAEEIERLKKETKKEGHTSSASKSRVIALSMSSAAGDNNEPKKRSWEEIAAPGAKLPTSQQPTAGDKDKSNDEKHRHGHRRSRSRSRDRPRQDNDRHVSRHDRDTDTSRDRHRPRDRDTGDHDRDNRESYRHSDRTEKRRKRSRSRSESRSDDEDSRRRHRHHHKEKKHHKDKKHHS